MMLGHPSVLSRSVTHVSDNAGIYNPGQIMYKS